jgi:hypothetical protein
MAVIGVLQRGHCFSVMGKTHSHFGHSNKYDHWSLRL